MRIGSRQYRYNLLLLPILCSLACGEGDLIAAPLGASLQTVPAERIVGGGGLKLATYEAGNASGPPIVFIHGFSGNHLTWEHQFSGPLAAEFRLVAFDLRGHGASDKPLEPVRYTNSGFWAEDLDAVIRAKNLNRPVLVGWSYGGFVIADYIRKFGDSKIGGVVFLGSSTKNGTAEAVEFLTPEVLALFPAVLSAEVQKSIEGTRALTRMFGNPLRDTTWEIAYGSAMMVPPEVRAAMFNRVLDNDDVLAGIRVPTLAIHGTGDRIVRVSAARHTVNTVPDATLLLYDGVSHAPHLEIPERLSRDLAEFVRARR